MTAISFHDAAALSDDEAASRAEMAVALMALIPIGVVSWWAAIVAAIELWSIL